MTEFDDPAVAADMLLAVQLVARRHDRPIPDGWDPAAERSVGLWQPALARAGR